jgi:hypothetical protein
MYPTQVTFDEAQPQMRYSWGIMEWIPIRKEQI